MIYLDNSATTLKKPDEVYEGMAYALQHFGNAGRSFYDNAVNAGREIYLARKAVAELTALEEPLQVAFTSSATESLNLVVQGLVDEGDEVITTVTEHNSVLRPLYLSGCNLSFLDCDREGVLCTGQLRELIKPNTKYMFCTHGSNVTGNLTDVYKIYDICRRNGILLILDVSQTMGASEVRADMADVLCFTGHKGLFGPQGTGGIIVNGHLPFRIVKTGGTGSNSFDRIQQLQMPELFEAGTMNSQGLYGLKKGVEFILNTGVEEIRKQEMKVFWHFYNGIKDLSSVHIYGDYESLERLPVLSLNIDGFDSEEAACRLWENYGIAVRAGAHCAPLLHKHFETKERGMVRFSFSYYNTMEEAETAVKAVRDLACGGALCS